MLGIYRFLLPFLAAIYSHLVIAEEVAFEAPIEWIIPFKAGGGSDVWARFIAPHLSRQLPGSPEIQVKNIPGGGSTKAANNYATDMVLDGSSLFGTSASTQFPFLLGDSRVRYNYDDWQPLLVYPTGGVVYISPEFGITKASELSHITDQKLMYGSQGATSIDLVPLLAFELLDLNVRPIFGVRGRDAGRVAFERGDASIDYQTTAAYLNKVQPLVEEGKAIPLFTFGALTEKGELVRDPAFLSLPHIAEVYEDLHGEPPSGIRWESWRGFFSAGFGAQKILVIPADTPAEIKHTFKRAAEAMLNDPEYLRSKGEILGNYEMVGGDAADRLYKLATDIPEAERRWIRNWLQKQYKLNL